MTPIRAALLSFLLPGLGQWAAGRWLRGLLFVAPLLGLVVNELERRGPRHIPVEEA